MKVADLIKELQECSQDSEVTIETEDISRVVIYPDGVVIETTKEPN